MGFNSGFKGLSDDFVIHFELLQKQAQF